MFTNKDELYIETSDIPNLNKKINRAIELSNELRNVLNDLDGYCIEFKMGEKKEET